MKNITVISVAKAFDRISKCKEKYSVLYIVKYRKFLEKLYHEKEKFGHLDLYAEQRKLRNLLKSDKSCIEVIAEQLKDDDYFIEHWQVDEIIRFCQRQFDIDNVFIIHEKHYDIAETLADQLALCYDIEFDYDFSVETYQSLRKKIITKYSLITNSLLYTLSPLDYCKEMCRLMSEQFRLITEGKRLYNTIGHFFFHHRQCSIRLKNGRIIKLNYETADEDIFFPDVNDIEYAEFYGVPEIAEPSAFQDTNCTFFRECGIYDFYNNNDSLKKPIDAFRFDSINGIRWR